jgi:23S rRNA pseudouridine1911/1915/1917 synthase
MNGGDNSRLDLALIRLGYARSRRAARQLIAEGRVRVNGTELRKGHALPPGSRVEIAEMPVAPGILPNPNIEIAVLFADPSLLIVNKPSVMPCHPLRGDERDTVMNAMAAVYPETASIGDNPLEGGLIHRLDNGTSGALMIARTPDALIKIRDALRNGRILREYRAMAVGRLGYEVEINMPIAHHPKNASKMIVGDVNGKRILGRAAFSKVSPIKQHGDFTLVSILPRTGRRHQIRVHLASIGHPIAGDTLYGSPVGSGLASGRFWLHLARIALDLPSGGRIEVEAPLPNDLTATLRDLGLGP